MERTLAETKAAFGDMYVDGRAPPPTIPLAMLEAVGHIEQAGELVAA